MFSSPRPSSCLINAATSVYARLAFASIEIDPQETFMADTHTVAGHAYADFIDEQGRADLVDLPRPVLSELVHSVDTTDIDSPQVDFGCNNQAGAPQ